MYIYIYEPNTSIDAHEKMAKEGKKNIFTFLYSLISSKLLRCFVLRSFCCTAKYIMHRHTVKIMYVSIKVKMTNNLKWKII